jgi:hypothetical protein
MLRFLRGKPVANRKKRYPPAMEKSIGRRRGAHLQSPSSPVQTFKPPAFDQNCTEFFFERGAAPRARRRRAMRPNAVSAASDH